MYRLCLITTLLCIAACKFGHSPDLKNVYATQISNDSTRNIDRQSNTQQPHFNSKLLIGVWALTNDTNENAAFELTKDSIFYADQEEPAAYLYKIENDSFKVFLNNYVATGKIISVSSNLFMTIDDTGDTVMHFRKT